MKFLRRSSGLFISIFLSIPLIFGIIWGAGIIKATTSSYFITELPEEIARRLPEVIQEAIEIAEKSEDANGVKDWFEASEKASVDWAMVMEETGMFNWVDYELKEKLGKLGGIFDGEEEIKDLRINLVPLKNALKHDLIYDSVKKVLEQLPEDMGENLWTEYIAADGRVDIPLVKPDNPDEAVEAIRADVIREIDSMQDYVEIVNANEFIHHGGEVSRFFDGITILMFCIPAFFVALGAWVGGYGLKGFLIWSGVTTLTGGGLAFASVKIVKGFVTFSSWLTPHANVEFNHSFISFGSLMFGRIEELFNLIFNALFDPVGEVAKVVCVVGIVLWALSFAINDSSMESKR